MKKLFVLLVSLIFGFALVGCTSSSDESTSSEESTSSDDSTSSEAATGLYCIISDGGGFEDKSFNQSAKAGAEQAQAELGVEIKLIESKVAEDFKPNIDSAIDQGCNLIITVGFNLAEQTKASAEEYPDQHFAIIDDTSIDLPNVKPIAFNTVEAAYLGGYVAAGVSKSGTIGVFGGMAIPTVQIFGDGLAQGVAKYNEAHSASVKLLGYDPADPSAMTVVGDFTDQTKGAQIGQQQIDQGADIIFPGAGAAGLGALPAIKAAGAYWMWPDVDGYYTNDAEYIPSLLVSVMKNIQPATYDVIKEDLEGNFTNTKYVGTLANNGVGISEFHDLDSVVPADVKSEVEALKNEIASGALAVTSEFTP